MGSFGFPSEKEMSEMFAYVTPEDRQQWQQKRDASKVKGSPGTAKEMAGKSLAPALDLAKHGVKAQLHAEQNEAKRGVQAKQKTRLVTRETVTEQSKNIDDSDAGYSPDF